MEDININKLAKSLMLEIKDDELALVNKKFTLFLNQIKEINEIDTTGVDPLNFPFEDAVGVLREDEFGEVLSVAEVLSNASDSQADMVKMPKVIL